MALDAADASLDEDERAEGLQRIVDMTRPQHLPRASRWTAPRWSRGPAAARHGRQPVKPGGLSEADLERLVVAPAAGNA